METKAAELKKIFFWEQADEYGCFSNFWPGPFVIDGEFWPTTEHYFAAMKTLDPKLRKEIQQAETPIKAKHLGRKVELRPDWESIRYEVMITALRAKFSIPDLRKTLLDSGDALIFEDSPFDKVWGTGQRGGEGTGMNLLGKALMQVRSELRAVGYILSGAVTVSTDQGGN